MKQMNQGGIYMKGLWYKRFIIGLFLLFIVMSGCTEKVTMTSISIDPSSLPDEVMVADFYLSDIMLVIEYSDGHTETIVVEEYMITETDLAKLSTSGEHTIIVHFLGFTTSFTINLTSPIVYELANGRYDFESLYNLEKEEILTKLEAYLMEHMYGGIPLVSQSKIMLFSDRVDLISERYQYHLGYTLPYLQLNKNDSFVKFDEVTFGNASEYTFRTYYTDETDNLNPWMNIPRNPTSYYDHVSGTLYERIQDPIEGTWEYTSSLADDYPVAIEGVMTPNGYQSTRWNITLKDQLSWYIPDGLEVDDPFITAEDFVWTIKEALKENFPLVSHPLGLSDSGIINVRQYLDGNAELHEVGINVSTTSNLTIELEFNTPVYMPHVLSLFASPYYSPIHQELYESLGNQYATSVSTTPSSGLFKLTSWTYEDSMEFEYNPLHPMAEDIAITGIHYRYFPDIHYVIDYEGIYQAYLMGELDMCYLPNGNDLESLSEVPYMIESSPTVWRLGINSLGTSENRELFKEKYPHLTINMDYELEPMLMYEDMRKALYYGVDRLSLIDDYRLGFSTEHLLISYDYALNPYVNSYRSGTTPSLLSQAYLEDSYGFDEVQAKEYFNQAIDQAIDDGYYTAGTEDNYTLVELSLYYQSGGRSEVVTLMENLEALYEAVLIDEEHHVRVDIQRFDIAFPSSYLPNLIEAGAYDLYFGGFSGAIGDLPGYMTVLSDLDPANFGLSIGIDTSLPEIELSYLDEEGDMRYEIWSYNALLSALMGVTYVYNGDIQKDFASSMDAISAIYDIDGYTVNQFVQKDNALIAYTGLQKDQYAANLNVDNVFGYVVTLDTLQKEFVIITETNERYLVHTRIPLYPSLNETIQTYVSSRYGEYYILMDVTPMMDDLAVQNHEYLQDFYDFDTLQDIADEYSVSIHHLKVYSTTWMFENGTTWTDVFLLIEIDELYLPLAWL